MKKLIYLLMLIFGLTLNLNAQKNNEDTLFVFLKNYDDFFTNLEAKLQNSYLLEDSLFLYKTYFIKKNGILFFKARRYNIESVMGEAYCLFYTKKGLLIAEGAWSFEVFHGNYIEYHENGIKKIEGVFQSGKKIGIWNYYDEEGKLIKEENYN